jgi:O-antigen/teichoic acid export membrane protein
MIAGFVFTIPFALSTALFAEGARDPQALADKMRFTLRMAYLTGGAACMILLVAADTVLRVFGNAYAEQGAWSLRVLVLAVFPLVIKDHYVALCRVQRRVSVAATVIAIGGMLEVILAIMGAHFFGLTGLCIGWTLAICLEALWMARPICGYMAAARAISPSHEDILAARVSAGELGV